MSKRIIEPGSIYVIPSAGRFGLAKVIFMPASFRGVVLIKLHPHALESVAGLEVERLLFDDACTRYYTGDGAIKSGHWTRVGIQQVSESERALTKRVIGGGVWIEDQYVGEASEDALTNPGQMTVYPYKLVEKIVSRFGSEGGAT